MGDTSKENTNLTWKGEVTFEGTIEQFNSFRAGLEKLPIRVAVPELSGKILPHLHIAGYIRPLIEHLLDAGQLEQITAGQPRMKYVKIKDIPGGIRNPHLHIGDEVVLIDKERFKSVLVAVARNSLEQRVDMNDDYFAMMKPLMVDD